ncbi:nucleoid-associated protein [Weissella viridescens]|uniref:Nucleoid-associated protein n=2 Tax=Weissella viridescens TaxID=1629 RepID=A0A3P2RL04_WEIVI|nr:nucleoid-associated protein [Weissella viridescens]RRG18342.1 nucleoid-associated protein [Weissella viridescens]
MIIKHAILHILDKDAGNLIASQSEMDISNIQIHEYLEGILTKFESGDYKPGQLNDADYIAKIISDDNPDNFVEKTTALADKLFSIVAPAENVPAGDLLCVEYANGTDDYFAMLKLNLVPHYTHTIDYEGDDLVNKLVLNRSILPDPTQTAQEGIIINLMNGSFQLVEKQYLIDGHRVNYFSQNFLEIDPETSAKDNIKTIKNAVKHVADKFDVPEHEALSTTQNAIFKNLQENEGAIKVSDIGDAVFAGNMSAQTAYQEITKEQSLDESIDIPNAAKYEKKYQVQRFKLDSGIEITIPIDIYQDKSKVEFVNNPDGTQTLLLKDIGAIMNKFNS